MDSVYKDIGITDINRRCEIHKKDRLHSRWLNKWLHRSTKRLKKISHSNEQIGISK